VTLKASFKRNKNDTLASKSKIKDMISNNVYLLVIFAFVLALLAHIKLSIIQRVTVEAFDTLSTRIEKQYKYIQDIQTIRVVEAPVVATEPEILSKVPERKLNLESNALKIFYDMTEVQRAQFFQDVIKDLKGISNDTFRHFWNACHGPFTTAHAFDIQTAIQGLPNADDTQTVYAYLRKNGPEGTVKTEVPKPVEVLVTETPVIKVESRVVDSLVETDVMSVTEDEDHGRSHKKSKKQRGRRKPEQNEQTIVA